MYYNCRYIIIYNYDYMEWQNIITSYSNTLPVQWIDVLIIDILLYLNVYIKQEHIMHKHILDESTKLKLDDDGNECQW